MCIHLEPTQTIFSDTNTQMNSREQKKHFAPIFCVFVYPSRSWKNHSLRKTLGWRNTDFLGYNTLDALVHENLIGLRPNLSSTRRK